ncbi:hypothetical protein PRIPAC_76775 [Pristionchus pacificus]|uniref:CUB domain-containing protein n=1 Tax=Pristionchus pacificus TaxID=54126 RepID=A0A454XU61_PRIPA|nr:hypothetical protein PRIPAC_76775 [Pristionchus pacificus]|eukprot:PDM73137.1 CUB domain-containing protein [Pristionchus pacificus]
MKLILFLTVLPALGAACPFNGFETWLDGRCFRQNYQTSVPYSESSYTCREAVFSSNEAHLPSIFTQLDNDQFYLSLDHQFGYTFWLGLSCDGEKFVWADGSEANYTNFAGDYKCTKAAVDFKYYYGNDKLWYESANGKDSGVNNVVCEAKTRSASPCDSYDEVETVGQTKTCYNLYKATSGWENADAMCTLDFAHLAVIHDQTLNDFIRRTSVSAGLMDGIHIGIQLDRPSGNFSWVDGTDVDYTNFQTGLSTSAASVCGYMDTKSSSGQWGLTNCETIPLPFICTKPAFYVSNPHPAGCPVKTQYAPGDDVYSPSYPGAPGEGICDYLLLEADPNKRVKLEVTFLESNACCDTLTIYDGLSGSTVLTTVSGWHPDPFDIIANSNAVRLHWNASSGVHVRGFHVKMLNSVRK